jgi:hypothetical protein
MAIECGRKTQDSKLVGPSRVFFFGVKFVRIIKYNLNIIQWILRRKRRKF